MITDRRAQKKCAFGGCLLALLIKPFFLFLRPSARCGHAASRHNRQVSLCLRLLMEATCSWLTGGAVRVICGCIQSCVSFCRYSGSGSSGAASMRKVGEQTALSGWLCISCFINLCMNNAVFPGHLTQTPFFNEATEASVISISYHPHPLLYGDQLCPRNSSTNS